MSAWVCYTRARFLPPLASLCRQRKCSRAVCQPSRVRDWGARLERLASELASFSSWAPVQRISYSLPQERSALERAKRLPTNALYSSILLSNTIALEPSLCLDAGANSAPAKRRDRKEDRDDYQWRQNLGLVGDTCWRRFVSEQ